MRIVTISDTHLRHDKLKLPEGDLLIHAGDATNTGTVKEFADFVTWLRGIRSRFSQVIYVAGNHDALVQQNPTLARALLADADITYLEDSGVTIDDISFWGSPWTPEFYNWSFMLPRQSEALKAKWGLIPPETQVLITHGPPYGFGDIGSDNTHVGCEELLIHLAGATHRVHVFGHIHSGHGHQQLGGTLLLNTAICSEFLEPVYDPFVIDIKKGTLHVVAQ